MTIDRLEFLVEEPSMGVTLDFILPKIIPGVDCQVIAFNGKQDLLKKLPSRLRGYRSWAGTARTGLVALAQALERVLRNAGHEKGGLRKILTAQSIAPHLDIENNRSVSFQRFRDGVRLLAGASHAEA